MRRSLPALAAAGVSGLCALTLATPALAKASTGPDVEAARQVTTEPNPTRLVVSPQIAVDPLDPQTLAVVAADGRNGGCALHVSRDGGLTWATTATTLLPEDLPFCVQRNFGPVATPVFASDGTLYVAMTGSTAKDTPNGPINGVVAKTTDLGITHTSVIAAPSGTRTFTTKSGQQVSGYEQWRLATLAVDPTNPRKLYAGYRLWLGGLNTNDVPFSARPERAYVAVSDDGGTTWSKPKDIFRLAIDDAQAARLDIGFGPKEQLDSDVPMLVTGNDGTVHAFAEYSPFSPKGQPAKPTELFMLSSADGGQTWTDKIVFDQFTSLGIAVPAIDRKTGTLYLAFDARGTSDEHASDIYLMRSTDNGATWTKPLDIVDENVQTTFNHYFPGISVAPNGRVDVAWHDFRNDPFFVPSHSGGMGGDAGERYADIYASYSTDGGTTWSPNLRLTDRSIDEKTGVTFNNEDERGPVGVASTNYAAMVTWPDTRAGAGSFDAQDAYFTRIRYDAPPPLPGTSTGNNVLAGFLGAGAALAFAGLLLLLVMSRRRGGRTPERGATASPVGARVRAD